MHHDRERERRGGARASRERDSSRPDHDAGGKPEAAGDGERRAGRANENEGKGSGGGGEGREGGRTRSESGKKGEAEGQDEGGGGGGGGQPNKAEWIVGIACGLLVLAAIGYLAYEALAGPDLPPVLSVRVERVVATSAGYVVELTVLNEGSRTASNVSVEGTLRRDTVVERSRATIDFVPGGTEREGGLLFTKPPAAYRLDVRATGFDRP